MSIDGIFAHSADEFTENNIDQNNMTTAFANDLRGLMSKHIKIGLKPEYAGAVLCVAAGAALHVLNPQPLPVLYASKHIDKASVHLSPLLPSVPPTKLNDH